MIPKYLDEMPVPKIVAAALDEFGTIEVPGIGNNPVILDWVRELGIQGVYNADEIPWCGLFMAICAKRAGFKPVKNFLWALSWSGWGIPVDVPMLGDVLIFQRSKGGHVGIYVGEDEKFYQVLGGNQSDQVCIRAFPKERLYAARRCPWKFKQPASVKRILLTALSSTSTKEH